MMIRKMENRDFTPEQLNKLLEFSAQCQINLLPYVSTENFCCIDLIARTISTVKRYNIIPEVYWNGCEEDYRKLLCLLSDGYPAVDILLAVARQRIPGEVSAISQRFHQCTAVMMELESRYGGYVTLKASEFMLSIYPSMEGKLFVYTSDIWEHREDTDVNKPVLIIDDIDHIQKDQIPKLIRENLR